MKDTRTPLITSTVVALAATTYLSLHDCTKQDSFSRLVLRICIAFQLVQIMAAWSRNMYWTEISHIVYTISIILLATVSNSRCVLHLLSALVGTAIVTRLMFGKCMYNYDETTYNRDSIFRNMPKAAADTINYAVLFISLYRGMNRN